MSYASPYIAPFNVAAISLDKVIQSLQFELGQLPWLDYSFGRAYEFKELDVNGKALRIPKCFTQAGEYINVLPNDFARAHSFIALKSKEEWLQFNYVGGSTKEAFLSIIIWGNLKKIDNTKNYIYTEILKNDVEKIIKKNEFVLTILSCIDERAEDVFNSYDLLTVKDTLPQYLMYPFCGFRIDLTVNYFEECDDTPLIPPNYINYDLMIPDINFFASSPMSSYQNDTLKGKKVRLFRSGIKQAISANDEGYYYSFDIDTGTVVPIPAFTVNEYVSLEIY